MQSARVLFLLAAAFAPLLARAACTHNASGHAEREVVLAAEQGPLPATIFLPSSVHPLPAIVVTHGSGREHRKLPGYRGLARHLACEGYAVLLYDKRGVGDAPGKYVETPDLHVPARDVLAAVDLLRKLPEVDAKRIGVLGHSQGGWIAPLAASLSEHISFVVSIAGPGVPPAQQILHQRGVELRSQGMDAAAVEKITAFGHRLFRYLADPSSDPGFPEVHAQVKDEAWFAFWAKNGAATLPTISEARGDRYAFYRNIQYDPAPVLASVSVPSLALFGTEDRQIPVRESIIAWKAAFREREELLSVHELSGEGHALWEMTAEGPRMRPAFMNELLQWLDQFRLQRASETKN